VSGGLEEEKQSTVVIIELKNGELGVVNKRLGVGRRKK
jgi:hypothetical protein